MKRKYGYDKNGKNGLNLTIMKNIMDKERIVHLYMNEYDSKFNSNRRGSTDNY